MARNSTTTLSFWQRSARQPEVRCDVAVVGGGIIGVSTAYWLTRADSDLSVCLLEAGRLASGATGRNAGFLLQGTATNYAADIDDHGREVARKLWQFSRENRDLVASELSLRSFEFEPSGSLTVAGSEDEEVRLRACVSRMRADGFPAAFIPSDEVNRRIMARGFSGGLYVASGAMVNPVLLTRHIAERSGARLLENHRVIELKGESGEVVLETPERTIRARRVVLAVNAYLPQLVPDLSRYVRPVRAQMLSLEASLPRWLQLPVYSHEGYYYIRQRPEGQILLGGARHLHALEERGYVDEVTDPLQTDLVRYLHHHFPQTAGLRIADRWSGTMGFSPDGIPVAGELPRFPGSVWAAGFTGHGMGYGFRFGRMLAEMARGHLGAEGAELFAADRFPDRQPILRSAPAGE
jgi:gamma-glutamylputrescine oxidase